MTTGSLPAHVLHTSGSVASSHMKCATLALLVLSGRKRLLTRPSCREYSVTGPSRSVSGRTTTHSTNELAVPTSSHRKSAARWLSLAGGMTPRSSATTRLLEPPATRVAAGGLVHRDTAHEDELDRLGGL